MENIFSQISNFGFPIVLSMYLLIRIEGKMEDLTASIAKLTSVLDEQRKG